MRDNAKRGSFRQAAALARLSHALVGWIAVAVSLGAAAIFFTSHPETAIGQTGPALTPPAPTPGPPTEKLEVFLGAFAPGAATYDRSRSDVRLFDVSTRESTPSRRRLPPTTAASAEQFIEATLGGQPLIGVQVSIGATGLGTLPQSLTRAQLARICFPASMTPPGVDVESLAVMPGRLVAAKLDREAVCAEFVFTEPGAFIVGTGTKPVVREFEVFYESTGGVATWGPCLTHGFFATVGPAGTIVEASPGSGVYMQVCANGALAYHPELAGTGYEIQPVLAAHWVRGENGQFVGPDPPAPNTGAGRYFPQTGHNVGGALLARFAALGGVDVLGYPVTERLVGPPGFTDQYFQHMKLRMDDVTGEVSIRPIGREFMAMLTANRQAGAESP